MIRGAIKSTAYKTGLWRLARYLNRHKSAILMYHGLSDDSSCADWTQVKPAEFKKQMLYLRENYNIVPLSEILESPSSRSGNILKAAVTFDDGYRSVYEIAAPILIELGIPATIYITSNFIAEDRNDKRYIWPDYIRVLLKSSHTSTPDLSFLDLEGSINPNPPNMNIMINRLIEYMKLCSWDENKNIISQLEDKYLKNLKHESFSIYHSMSWDEVARLASNNLFSIGAHTKTHPILSRVPDCGLEDEITGSKAEIESRLKIGIDDFAYPNGRLIDFDSRSIEIVKKEFKSAATTLTGLNRDNQDPYLLNRIGVGRNMKISQLILLLSGLYR